MNERTKNRFISVYIKKNHLCGLINFMEPCNVIIMLSNWKCNIVWLARISFSSSSFNKALRSWIFVSYCCFFIDKFDIALIQFEISWANLHFIAFFSSTYFLSLQILIVTSTLMYINVFSSLFYCYRQSFSVCWTLKRMRIWKTFPAKIYTFIRMHAHPSLKRQIL